MSRTSADWSMLDGGRFEAVGAIGGSNAPPTTLDDNDYEIVELGSYQGLLREIEREQSPAERANRRKVKPVNFARLAQQRATQRELRSMKGRFGMRNAFVRAVDAGLRAGGADFASLLARITGNEEKAREIGRRARAIEQAAQQFDRDPEAIAPDRLARNFRGALRTLHTAIPAGVAAGPPGAIAAGSVTSANRAFNEAKTVGLDDSDAAQFAAITGGLEGAFATAFQLAGAPGLEKAFARRAAGQLARGAGKKAVAPTVGRLVAQEAIEEVFTEIGQAFVSAGYDVDPNATKITHDDGSFIDAEGNLPPLPQALIDATVQSAIAVGMTNPPPTAPNRVKRGLIYIGEKGRKAVDRYISNPSRRTRQQLPDDIKRQIERPFEDFLRNNKAIDEHRQREAELLDQHRKAQDARDRLRALVTFVEGIEFPDLPPVAAKPIDPRPLGEQEPGEQSAAGEELPEIREGDWVRVEGRPFRVAWAVDQEHFQLEDPQNLREIQVRRGTVQAPALRDVTRDEIESFYPVGRDAAGAPNRRQTPEEAARSDVSPETIQNLAPDAEYRATEEPPTGPPTLARELEARDAKEVRRLWRELGFKSRGRRTSKDEMIRDITGTLGEDATLEPEAEQAADQLGESEQQRALREQLQSATEEEIRTAWEGLGFKSRGRKLNAGEMVNQIVGSVGQAQQREPALQPSVPSGVRLRAEQVLNLPTVQAEAKSRVRDLMERADAGDQEAIGELIERFDDPRRMPPVTPPTRPAGAFQQPEGFTPPVPRATERRIVTAEQAGLPDGWRGRISKLAEVNRLEPVQLESAARSVLEQRMAVWREDPLREFRRRYPGLTLQVKRAQDVASVPRFDEVAEEYLNSIRPGAARDVEDLFLRLRDYSAEPQPRLTDPETLDQAVEVAVSEETAASEESRLTEAERELINERAAIQEVEAGFVDDDAISFDPSEFDDDVPQTPFGPTSVGAGERSPPERTGELTGQTGQATPEQAAALGAILPETRPELANPAGTALARAQVLELRKEIPPHEIQRDREVQAEAEQRLASDYEAEFRNLLEQGDLGRQLDPAGTVVAREIIERESRRSLREWTDETLLRARRAVEAYQNTGRELAREFRQRRDRVQNPQQRMGEEIHRALHQGSAGLQARFSEADRRRHDARERGDEGAHRRAMADLERLRTEWLSEVRRARELLERMGFDLENMDEITSSPRKASHFLNQLEASYAGWMPKVIEFWRNSILSALQTTGADVLSSAAYGGYKVFLQRGVEATLNLGKPFRETDGATWREFADVMAGIYPGLRRGMANAWEAAVTEQPQLQQVIDPKNKTAAFGSLNHAIGGKLGRFVRAAGYTRLLMADEITQTWIWHMEVGAQARRLALQEGFAPGTNAMQARIAQLVEDPESEASRAALRVAREVTFQQEGSKTGQRVKRIGRDVQKTFGQSGSFIVPFATTPVNIVEKGLTESPLGAIGLMAHWHRARVTGDYSGLTPRHANQIIAWGAAMALLLSNDEEDPWITGSIGEREFQDVETRNRPRQSIKIGGEWVSYKRIEPFATGISITVDLANALRNGSAVRAAFDTAEATYNTITLKSYLQSIGDILRIGEYGFRKGLARWVGNFAASWVPNLVRHGSKKALQDDFPERRVWGTTNEEWFQRAAKRAVQRTELPQTIGLLPDHMKHDLWGRRMPRSQSPIPYTDFLFRTLIPSHVQEEDVFIGDRILMRWNELHPDQEANPRTPLPIYTDHTGKRRSMNDAEAEVFVRLSGRLAANLVGQIDFSDPANPTQHDVDLIEKQISKARRTVRNALSPFWSGAVDNPGEYRNTIRLLEEIAPPPK